MSMAAAFDQMKVVARCLGRSLPSIKGGYMDYDAEYLLNWCHALQFTLVIVSLRAIDRSSGGDRGGKTT